MKSPAQAMRGALGCALTDPGAMTDHGNGCQWHHMITLVVLR